MKLKIFFFPLIFAFAFLFLGAGCLQKEKVTQVQEATKQQEDREEVKSEKDQAIEKSKELFQQKKEEGMDMSQGPCLSNEIIPGWVLDVAHSPRQAIDNQPENQCSAYREGKANHFVELDPEGNLIQAY